MKIDLTTTDRTLGALFLSITVITLIYAFQQHFPNFFLASAFSFAALLCLLIGIIAFRDARKNLAISDNDLPEAKAKIKLLIETFAAVTLILGVLGVILFQTVHNPLIQENIRGSLPTLLLAIQASTVGRKMAIAKAELSQIKK